MQRFDIYDIPAGSASNDGSIRACVVVSSDLFNKYAPTVIVIPLTTVLRDPLPSEFIVEPSEMNGLLEKFRLLGSQLLTLDRRLLRQKTGELDLRYRNFVEKWLRLVLDLR